MANYLATYGAITSSTTTGTNCVCEYCGTFRDPSELKTHCGMRYCGDKAECLKAALDREESLKNIQPVYLSPSSGPWGGAYTC